MHTIDNTFISEDTALTLVRRVCFEFSAAAEKLSHGSPFFHVKNRGFAIFAFGRRDTPRPAVWIKSTTEDQQRLVRENPSLYFVPPYVGVKGWIGLYLNADEPTETALTLLIEEAWRSVTPKSLQNSPAKLPKKHIQYLTTDPAIAREALDRLDSWVKKLPGAVIESRPHSGPCATVRQRVFAYLFDNHHRDGIVSLAFRTTDGAALVKSSSKLYYLPAYIAARGWVAIRVDLAKTPWAKAQRHIEASYHSMVARKH